MSENASVIYTKCTPDYLEDLEKTIQRFPELELDLRLLRALAKTHDYANAAELKGFDISWDNNNFFQHIEREALRTDKDYVQLLSPINMFEIDLHHVLIQFVGEVSSDEILSKNDFAKQLNTFSSQVQPIDLKQLAEYVLARDFDSLTEESKRFKIPSDVLRYIVETVVKPFLTQLFRKLDDHFLTHWKRPECPICGQIPFIARINDKKMFMYCDLCDGTFWVDYFRCPSCGSDKPQDQQFYYFNDKLDFFIFYCTQCKFYWNAIDDDKLKIPIPSGFERFYLSSLDQIAQEEGLTRKIQVSK